MGALEAAAVVAGLVEDADQVDGGIAAGEHAIEHGLIVHIGFDQLHGRNDEQVALALAAPRRDADPPAVTGQPAGEMAADEAAATEDADHPAVHAPQLSRWRSPLVPVTARRSPAGLTGCCSRDSYSAV